MGKRRSLLHLELITKWLVVALVSSCILTGCNNLPNKITITPETEKVEYDYEPTPQQLAKLFNSSVQKLSVSVKTPITFMVPERCTYYFTPSDEVQNAEYKLNITGSADDTECCYSWYLIPNDNIIQFRDNVIRYTGSVSNNVSTNKLYSYSYSDNVDLKLYGDTTLHSAKKQTVICDLQKYTEYQSYKLPVVWYYWKLSNNYFLVLRVKLKSVSTDSIYDINSNIETFALSANEADPTVVEDAVVATSLYDVIDSKASYILNYVLLGNYTTRYWKHTQQRNTDTPSAYTEVDSIDKNNATGAVEKIDANSYINKYLQEESGVYDNYTVSHNTDFFN